MRDVPVSFFVTFDEVDAVFDFSVDVVVVGGVEVPPEYVFLVEHEFEELYDELVLGSGDFMDGYTYFFCSFCFFLEGGQIFV